MASNNLDIFSCALNSRVFASVQARRQKVSGGGLSRGEKNASITRGYAFYDALSALTRTQERHILTSAMGCKTGDKRMQPKGRLGLQVSDFHSSSFQGRQNISPYLFWLAKVGCSGQTAKYRCTISSEFLQQPSSFFLNARYG